MALVVLLLSDHNDLKVVGGGERLKQIKDIVYRPISDNKATYDELYSEYYTLSEYFAKSESRVMEILKKYK